MVRHLPCGFVMASPAVQRFRGGAPRGRVRGPGGRIPDPRREKLDAYLMGLPSEPSTYHLLLRPWPFVSPAALSPPK